MTKDTFYADSILAFVESQDGLEAVKKRLIPEGMEWPKYTDGSLVEIGDEVVGPDYGERFRADTVTFHVNGFTLREKSGMSHWYESDDRFERPAPKVLDADGVEIREGDTVWDEHGDELVVLAVYGQDVHCRYAEYEDQICDNGTWEPLQLTHRAPVLDADGKPLREGDTVWDTNGNGPYSIQKIENDCVIRIDGRGLDYFGYEFVRERPDSWEKVWSDVYQGRTGSREMACRCMALAERGQ